MKRVTAHISNNFYLIYICVLARDLHSPISDVPRVIRIEMLTYLTDVT